MNSRRPVRPESEITEADDQMSYRRVAFWAIVGIAVIIGVVSYFKYGRLLPPLLG